MSALLAKVLGEFAENTAKLTQLTSTGIERSHVVGRGTPSSGASVHWNLIRSLLVLREAGGRAEAVATENALESDEGAGRCAEEGSSGVTWADG